MQIESKRLYCRPFERADFENFYKLHKNNETSKLMGKGVISDEEIESRFNRNLKHQDGFGFSAWATFEKDTNKFVGRVGFVKIGTLVATDEDHSDKIEIGYAFLPEFWGHGYAQEIIPVFLNYGFNILKLEAIYAKTSKDNQKSQYLLRQKFHFEYVSDIMVENRVSELFIQKNTNKLHIGTATLADTESIISIWEEAKLTRSWNNPNDDIKNALTTPTSTILLLCDERQIVGTVMVGYDGHRGWIYYLAVRSEFQKKGYGKQLVQEAEKWLKSKNVPKVNLMIRNSNEAVKSFYEACEYKDDEVIVMAKWLK